MYENSKGAKNIEGTVFRQKNKLKSKDFLKSSPILVVTSDPIRNYEQCEY